MKKQELTEKMDEYIVIALENDYAGAIKITKRSNFEEINYCATYKLFGGIVGCYDAGCYCFGNCESNFREDCLEELKENFSNITIQNEDLRGITDSSEMIEIFEDYANFEEIKKFIIDFEKEEEVHTEVTAWTYWDGSNWKTIVIEGDVYCDGIEVEKELAEKILSEMPESPYIDGAIETIETENFEFTFSRYANDPWTCSVEKL